MALFLIIILSCIKISHQVDHKPVEEVCQLIKTSDEDLFQEMSKPGPLDDNVILGKMKKYIAAIDELIKCLHTDKEGTYKVAKDIIDKKGAKFIQDIPWTWKMARLDWGWDGRVIQEFLNCRMEVVEAWMDVDKYFDPTAFIPKELYKESNEESVKKAS